jgi:acetyl esterase/lipase
MRCNGAKPGRWFVGFSRRPRLHRRAALASFIAVVAGSLPLACLSSGPAFTWQEVKDAKPDRSVPYQTRGSKELTLGVFTPPDFDPATPRPALMIIHGGSWVSGAPDLFFAHARYFARRGLVVFDVEYRLAAAGGPTLFNCLEDVQAALRYVRAHAKELGINPQRVAVAGDSAGGHLAACLGVAMPAAEMGLDPKWERADVVILWNPEVDLTTLGWAQGTPGIPQAITNAPGAGLSPAAKLRLVSPIFHITPGLPPCLIIHGTKDTCVSIEQSVRYEAAMKKAENACRLLTYEGIAHAFILPQYGNESLAMRAMRDTDLFLIEKGYLQGDPLIGPPSK